MDLTAADEEAVTIEGLKRRWRRHAAKRRAGYRARAKYRKQRKAWLRSTRKNFAMLTVACAVLAVGIHAYFGWIDGDQRWMAGCLTGLLLGLLIGLRQSPPGRVTNWEEGAWGEELTASELGKLPDDEWNVLHDLRNGKWNFDHVVVNDHAVFLINSKWSTNRLVSIDSGGVHLVNRFDEEQVGTDKKVMPQARRDARDLAQLIESRTGLKVQVQAVIAWWGPFQAGSTVVNKILVAQGRHLVEQLERYQGSEVHRQAIVNTLQPGRRRAGSTTFTSSPAPLDGVRP